MNRATWMLALIAVLASGARVARADLPGHFVPQDQCMSRDCTCDDVPFIEIFLENQKAARTAWQEVKTNIATPTGPASPQEAIADFSSRFMGDQRVVDQFTMCPGYDPAVNDPNKVAGVSAFGQASLDPCFCAAFCKDIVGSTVIHETMHVPTNIAGVLGKGDMLVGCSLGLLSGRLCDALIPMTLAESEVLSYSAGIAALQLSLDHLKAHDPAMPELMCTWQPLAAATAAPLTQQPEGFFARLAMLWDRIVAGAPTLLASI